VIFENVTADEMAHYEVATVYAALGENEKALHYLERAVEARSPSLYMLKIDPRFAEIHSTPRFAALLQRVGLS
jgi:tetratricopeptide (TPR) repeat protein